MKYPDVLMSIFSPLSLVPTARLLEECDRGDLLQHLPLQLHLEGGVHPICRPRTSDWRPAQHPPAQTAPLDHLHQLRLHQHPPLPHPEGDLRHLPGDDFGQGVPPPDLHAGQRREQKNLHRSPDISLLGQPLQPLFVLQGGTLI